MNKEKILTELAKLHPEHVVRFLPSDDAPTLAVCEFDSRENHSDFSFATFVVDMLPPHVHRRTTVMLRVLVGELQLQVDRQEMIIYEGQEWTVLPGQKYCATGNETFVEMYYSPGFDEADYFDVEME